MNAPGPRAVVVAGHTGDTATALAGWTSSDPAVRAVALGALERLGELDDTTLGDALHDPDVAVRRRAAEVAAAHRSVDLLASLHDPDDRVVEVAAWSCGEHESRRVALDRAAPRDLLERVYHLAYGRRAGLVLGAIIPALT